MACFFPDFSKIQKKQRHHKRLFKGSGPRLGQTIDADFDVFKVHSTVCKDERMKTTGFTRVKWFSKSLQDTIVHNEHLQDKSLSTGRHIQKVTVATRWPWFDLNKIKCACLWESWLWRRARGWWQQMLIEFLLIKANAGYFRGYKTFTTRWSGGRVQVWPSLSPFRSSGNLSKAVPEGNQRFRGQN